MADAITDIGEFNDLVDRSKATALRLLITTTQSL
jgi:hypothetical protein